MAAGDATNRRQDAPIELDYGLLVKRLREHQGLTQQQLAREVGVTYATVNGWERGRHRPIPALAKVLRSLAKDAGIQSAEVSATRDGAQSKQRAPSRSRSPNR